MIVRLFLYLEDGVYKFQNKRTEDVADATEYEIPFEIKGSLGQYASYGQTRQSSNIRVIIFELKNYFRKMFANYERSAILGKLAKIIYYKEEDGVSPSLVEKGQWHGVIDWYGSRDGNLELVLADIFSELSHPFPENQINEANYPNALDSSFGQYVPMPYGTMRSKEGILRAWNVDTNTYLLAGWDITDESGFTTGVSWRGIVIDTLRAYFYTSGTPLQTYINYEPPTDDEDSELPTDDVEFLSVNIEMVLDNPIKQLKKVTDLIFGVDEFWTGNATLESTFDSLGYKGAIVYDDGSTIQQILDEFCLNWNCYYYISEGKLILDQFDSSSVKTFTAEGLVSDVKCWKVSDRAMKENIRNSLEVKFAWSSASQKYEKSIEYTHEKSIRMQGKIHRTFELSHVYDKDTAQNMARDHLQQRKYVPVQALIYCDFDDVETLVLGDAVTVNHEDLTQAGDVIYNVIGIDVDLESEEVKLTLLKIVTENDFIVVVSQNVDGGVIDKLGFNVVPAGSNFFCTVTPHANMSVDFIFENGVGIAPSNDYQIINIAQDYDVRFNFIRNKFLIKASSAGHGTIDPSGDQWVTAGNNKQFTFTGAGGYVFDHYSIDGTTSGVNPYTFTNVQADHIIVGHANIVHVETYLLTVTYTKAHVKINPISPGNSRKYPRNRDAFITFQPLGLFTVDAVTLDGAPQNGTYDKQGLKILMDEDHTVVVTTS